jgi:hypothetical protein
VIRLVGKTALGSWSADLYTLVAGTAGYEGHIRIVSATIGGHVYRLLFVDLWNYRQDSPQQYDQRYAHDLPIFETVRENFTYHA